ncbi:hypothetical protein FRB93_001709 [Tulasnella sp. JGI-2019a]|nr:hypothetical protein FRB93_001709 [Tulasnella sp. JGI-2019a]
MSKEDGDTPSVARQISGYLYNSLARRSSTEPDPLPFASLSISELQHLGTPPPKYSRNNYATPQSSKRGGQRATSPLSTPRDPRTLRRKAPRRSPSPSPASSRYWSPSPSLRLSLRDRKSPRRSRSERQQRERSPRRRQSWCSYLFSPSWSLLLMIIFPSIAIICLSNLLQPLTNSIGNVVTKITNIDLFGAIGATTSAAFSAIPYAAIWCNTAGFGCKAVDRYAAYTTDSFHLLDVPLEQISLGNDFFDCLNDLKITRQQKNVVAHLVTLAPKVMQYEHVLESPEELSDNLILLARTRREIVMNANAARVTGRGTVSNIIQEYDHAHYLSSTKSSPNVVKARLRDTMSSVHESLQATSDYTLRTSSAVETAEEVASKVAVQIHHEISRLRRLRHESEMGLEYVAWGWLADAVQPGKRGMKGDGEKAAKFLAQALRVVDEGAIVLLSNSMSLQQCAINTRGFKDQVERAFTLGHERLSVHAQLQHLSPSIESLETRLAELRQSDMVPAIAQIAPPEGGSAAPGGPPVGTAT